MTRTIDQIGSVEPFPVFNEIDPKAITSAEEIDEEGMCPINGFPNVTGWSPHDTMEQTQNPLEEQPVEDLQQKKSFWNSLLEFLRLKTSSAPLAPTNTAKSTANDVDLSTTKPISQDKDVEYVWKAHEKAIKDIENASIDNILGVFFANARINHAAGTALSRLNQKAKEWSHEEAKTIKSTHNYTPHAWNIAGAFIQAVAGVYAIGAQRSIQSNNANYHAQMMSIQTNQQSGSAIGGLVQQGHGYYSTANEGERTLAQSHQGALSTDRQHSSQEVQQVKQASTGSLEKAGQAIQAKDQAFNAMAR